MRGLGLDILTAATGGWPIRIVLSEINGTNTIFDIHPTLTGAFFGATSDVGFLGASLFSLTVNGGTTSFALDNVTTASRFLAVPEPTTLLLTAAALPYLARRARRSYERSA